MKQGVSILIAGDFYPTNRVSESFENNNFSALNSIKELCSKVDYSVVNFEGVIVDENSTPIVKQGPCLGCTEKIIDALKYAGFRGVTLANNHFGDYGANSVAHTISLLSNAGIDFVGGGNNLEEASKILYKDINGSKIAFINFCEHEFSIATSYSGGSNPLNIIKLYNDIRTARKESDYVILISHGGNEMCQIPSPRMKEMFHFFVDAGADAVINHHQHCINGYEVYNGKPIVYGLGNFCFDTNPDRKLWHKGYLVQLNLMGGGILYLSTIPYVQCIEQPIIEVLQGDNQSEFEQEIEYLNTIISNDDKLFEEYQKWNANHSVASVLSSLEFYRGRVLTALYNRHLLPSSLTKKYLLKLLNNVECEANRDSLIYTLKSVIYGNNKTYK